MAETVVAGNINQKPVSVTREPSSRVASALATVKAPAVTGFGYTIPLGNRLRLKKIRVWFLPVWTGGGDWVDFWIRFGQGTPTTYVAMSDWENVIPLHLVGSPPQSYREFQTGRIYEWTMNRLFVGEAIRFGIQLTTAGLITYEEMYATFEIAEG